MNQKDFHQILYNTLLESLLTDSNYVSLGLNESNTYQMFANRNIRTKSINLDEIPYNSKQMLLDDINSLPDKASITAYAILVHYKPRGYKMDIAPGTTTTIEIQYNLECPADSGGTINHNIILYQFLVNFYRGCISIYSPSGAVTSFEDTNLQESNFTNSDFFDYLKSILVSYITS